MLDPNTWTERLQKFGVGRKKLDDELFTADGTPSRLGLYHREPEEDEDLCQPVSVVTSTNLQLQQFRCGTCGRALPAPHLLHLHLLETHDSYFAVTAVKKPSYCCYIQECMNKFRNAEERLDHCVRVHKIPKDFRYDIKCKPEKKSKSQNVTPLMDVDDSAGCRGPQKLYFHNNKQKTLQYSGKKFTSDKTSKPSVSTTHMDEIMSDLKMNLPK